MVVLDQKEKTNFLNDLSQYDTLSNLLASRHVVWHALLRIELSGAAQWQAIWEQARALEVVKAMYNWKTDLEHKHIKSAWQLYWVMLATHQRSCTNVLQQANFHCSLVSLDELVIRGDKARHESLGVYFICHISLMLFLVLLACSLSVCASISVST